MANHYDVEELVDGTWKKVPFVCYNFQEGCNTASSMSHFFGGTYRVVGFEKTATFKDGKRQ